MSANLIGLGADLQQKLDAMDARLRRARWAGAVGVALYEVAVELRRLRARRINRRSRAARRRAESRLLDRAQREADKLGDGVAVLRTPDPLGWPIVVVFPQDVPEDAGPETAFEQGVAIPPEP